MSAPGRHQKERTGTFQPFPQIPAMSLRLFGITRHDVKLPNLGATEVKLQAHHRYQLFREGIAELLEIQGENRRNRAGDVASMLIRGRMTPEFFDFEEGHYLTYTGEALDGTYARAEQRRILKAKLAPRVIQLFEAVSEGTIPEAWQQLHDETATLATEAAEG